MDVTRLWIAEERGVGERNLGVWRGDDAGTGEIIRADCGERREGGLGLARELRSASMNDKRGNGHNVKGKPGQGGTPETMGRRVARRGGPGGQTPEKPTGMGHKKVHWL